MKKKISSIIVLVLAVSMLVLGCSSGSSSSSSSSSSDDASSETTDTTEATVDDSEEAASTDTTASEYPALKQNAEQLVLGYIHGRNDAESQQRSARQVEIEAEHRGWKLVDVTWDTDQETRDGIQNLINQNVDAILIANCNSMDAKVDLVKSARQKGIGVYDLDNQLVDGVIANSTMPGAVAAMELMYQIGQDYTWNANIATISEKSVQGHIERTYPVEGFLGGVYSGLKLLDSEDLGGSSSPSSTASDITDTWLQKYGDEVDVIFGSADLIAIGAAESIIKNGDATGEHTISTGIDGGSQVWSYIRKNTPLKYSYAQPIELYAHNIMELIDQLQVQGMQIGDEDCLISSEGEMIYASGMVITPNNVPDVGESIHAVFDYYGLDKDDPDLWFNWTEGDGPYIIEE